ncbi:MAG: CAP domain-containing protein [Paracoccus sp. (in: a-proteobacteria)]
MRIRAWTILIIGAALAAPMAGPRLAGEAQAAISCAQPSQADLSLILANVNNQRQGNGLPAVRVHPALVQAAAQQACDMARRGQMSHSGRGGVGARVRSAGYGASVTAENIGAGQVDAAGVVRMWVQSPSHLSNILHRRVRDIGVGQAIGADGRTRYWSLVLAAPR